MKNLSFFFLFQCLAILVSAQDIPTYDHKFTSHIESEQAAGQIKAQRAAWFYTYIGDYQKAIKVYNQEAGGAWGFDTLNTNRLEFFNAFSAVNAEEYIIKRAEKEQLIIFNEAHHVPQHRFFLKQLLPALKDKGFTYLGLEAFTNCKALPPNLQNYCDPEFNERGYPLNSPLTGTYTREPQMAQLIREAHRLGIRLFAYEGKKDRERNQAENIYEILKADPDAKIIILCGYSHLKEIPQNSRIGGGKFMACRLKEMSGIDPLTINQVVLTEAAPKYEVALYQNINLPNTSVFLNKENIPFSGWAPTNACDVLVYHPRTSYTYGKPNWLINEAENSLFVLQEKDIQLSYPVLVKAWKKEEPKTAVPIDVVEKLSALDKKALVLPKGEFLIEIESMDGQKQAMELLIK